LNFVARKNEINKINQENNAFLQKLQAIKPAITDTRKLVKVMENVRLLGAHLLARQLQEVCVELCPRDPQGGPVG
jgi:hypothetical protein